MKVIYLLLAGAFVAMALVSCSSGGGSTIEDTKPPGTVPQTAEETTVGTNP
jgi:hypothetical protein